jgi:anti-sigma28 factor (negative regulator of flagellin synthesis)
MNKLNMTLKINNSETLKVELKNISNEKKGKVINIKNNMDKVSLSNSSKLDDPTLVRNKIASDMRYELIKKYKTVLAEGTYKIKSDELADKMIQKIKENKNTVIF